MRKFTFSFKSLLVAAGLLLGSANAWGDGVKRVLEHQDYENANVTDWHSNNGTISRTTGDATYGAYTNFAWQSGDGANRSAYKQVAGISGTGFTTKEMSTNGYNVEFDISLKSGNKKNKSESQFIVVSTLPYNITANAAYSGTDYLFSLSMGQFAEDGYKTTWYINDLANTSGTTKTLENTKWYHVKLVVTATSVAYTITDNSTSTVVHSGSKTVASMPTIRGFYSLNAYGGAFMKFDNLEIYDYSSLPAMTKLWGQDYRTVTKSQTEMASASGDATCTNAISTGESFYWIPSLDGSSAATNENVGFYCKNSNSRKWKIANTSSGKCYQGIVNTANSSTVHIYNLKKGQIVKVVGWAANDASPLYDGAGVLTALTGYDNGGIRYYEVNANGTGELTISVSFAYVYAVEVFEPDNEIVGALDFSTPANGANSSDYTMKPGDTKVFTFQNHGQDYGKNWRIAVKQGETWKANVCADSYDYIANAATKVSYQVSKDGGSSKVGLNWTEFQTDMADARVVATLAYGTDGKLAITTTSTGVANGYIYYVDQDVTGLEGSITVNLSVNASWLEILSVEQTQTTTSSTLEGYKTFYDATTNYQVDANTTIYKGSATKETVTLTSVVGDIIPKNTPVVLKTTNTTDYTIALTATETEAAAGAFDGNDLQVAAGGESDVYILAYTTLYGFGFYNFTGTLDAGDVYLAIPLSVKMLNVVVDGTATGVEAPVAAEAEEDGVYYNLNGQQVTKDYKGIVIVNGKKFYNK